MTGLQLPRRAGPVPRTSYRIPHQQIGQNPDAALHARLVERFLAMPETSSGPSLISVPGAQALFLVCDGACNERDGFFRGREFAHVHPAYDGSFHMMLSERDCRHVLEQRWGELHPYAASGRFARNATMVWAPRDEAELDVVLAIARASLRHAKAGSPEG